jgi:hypothetical protein
MCVLPAREVTGVKTFAELDREAREAEKPMEKKRLSERLGRPALTAIDNAAPGGSN